MPVPELSEASKSQYFSPTLHGHCGLTGGPGHRGHAGSRAVGAAAAWDVDSRCAGGKTSTGGLTLAAECWGFAVSGHSPWGTRHCLSQVIGPPGPVKPSSHKEAGKGSSVMRSKWKPEILPQSCASWRAHCPRCSSSVPSAAAPRPAPSCPHVAAVTTAPPRVPA